MLYNLASQKLYRKFQDVRSINLWFHRQFLPGRQMSPKYFASYLLCYLYPCNISIMQMRQQAGKSTTRAAAERLASLDITGEQLRASLITSKHHGTIVLRGLRCPWIGPLLCREVRDTMVVGFSSAHWLRLKKKLNKKNFACGWKTFSGCAWPTELAVFKTYAKFKTFQLKRTQIEACIHTDIVFKTRILKLERIPITALNRKTEMRHRGILTATIDRAEGFSLPLTYES